MKDDALNRMREDELMNYITNELYIKINQYREMTKTIKLYKDDCAELAIKDYFFFKESTEDALERLMKEVNFL
jgi:hypothetical protein